MATEVKLPQWGMNMEEGTLVKWLVKEGDTIEKGQPLVEIETAKINSELEAPVSGMVAHLMVPEGETVDVGTLVVVLGEPGEEVARPTAPEPKRALGRAKRTIKRPEGPGQTAQVTPVARRLARQHNVDLSQVNGTGPNSRITEEDVRAAIDGGPGLVAKPAAQVVPRARQLAKQHDLDLSQVDGTGPNDRITEEDVQRAIATSELLAKAEVIPLTGIRKIIADRMMQSVQSSAQVTLTTEADFTDASKAREELLSRWRPHRIRPLEIDLIVKAAAAALKEHPRLNATLVDDSIRLLEEIHVGLAMAIPDGLIVPVIRQTDEKDLLSIATEIRALADKSRKGDLSIDDMTGATFSITSLSNYDIDAFTPIIDPPQVAILGVGRVIQKPAVYEGEIAVRSMISLSLTFDHRALDGVPAGEFLRTIKRKLEEPAWMLSEDGKS